MIEKMNRAIKQLIIGFVYLAVFGTVGFGVYRHFFPAPTCFDGIQNQGEEGIDCGPICGVLCAPAIQPLELQFAKAVPVVEDEYDIVISVRNPNSVYGSAYVPYTVSVINPSGTEIRQNAGAFYIMPGQTRFIIEPPVHSGSGLSEINFQIGQPEWRQVDKPLEVMFPIKREQYKVGTSPDYEGVVLNDSNFDFQTVDIAVVIFDTADAIIAVNRTNINTLLAHEERYFKVSWPSPLPPNSARIMVDATTNLFLNDNFIKTHGVHEPFQEFR